MLRFDGRTAIVTGAGRGLGRAHALLLAERGANVVVNDLGDGPAGGGESPAGGVVEEIVAAGGSAVACAASVADRAGAEAIVATALEAFGGLDVVVNNAGVIIAAGFPETTPEDLGRNLAVHVAGSFNVTRAAWPHLIGSDAGRVLLTTSAALFGSRELVAYGSAKGGLVGLGRSLAAAGARVGVKVNLIAPLAQTRMAGPSAEPDPLLARLPVEQTSPLVAFLAHHSCPVSGEIYAAGGGRVTRIFIAETEGFAAARLTPELVAENWDEVNAEAGYHVPRGLGRYTADFVAGLAPASGGVGE